MERADQEAQISETKSLINRGIDWTKLEQLFSGVLAVIICILTAGFGYFALCITKDPLSCLASADPTANDIVKAPTEQGGFIQVGKTMNQTFTLCFAMSLGQIMLHTTLISSKQGELSRQKRTLIQILMVMAFVVQAFALVNAYGMRMTHAGHVCSGDFLSPGASTEGYLAESAAAL